jgi:hypothetical protein
MPTTTVQSAVTLKTGQAVVRSLNVCVAGSTNGTVCDAASTGAANAANAVAGLPSVAGDCSPPMPIICAAGLTVVPGTGQTIWINWE